MIDFLTRVLFESLPWLLVFTAVAMAVAIAVHRVRQTRGSRRGIWLTLAVCLCLIVVQHLVVTDREALEDALHTMVRAVDDGDMDTIGRYVDADFRMGETSRQAFLDATNRTLQIYQVDGARVTNVDTQVAGDGATVSFWVRCDIRGTAAGSYAMVSHWRIHFVRRDGGWLMDRIEEGRAEAPIGTGGAYDLTPYVR